MALDLCEKLLLYLKEFNTADTLYLSYQFKEDHQKVVGAVKSLLSLGNLITAEQQNNKKWELTGEGKMVVEKGSHEVHFFNAIPPNGIPQAELMKVVLNPKIGFSKAMSNGWITLDKNGDVPVILRKVESVKDVVQEHLCLILNCQADEVSDNQKQEYKKRKLVQEVVIKSYALAKGEEFSIHISKPETDLTPEMIASGSWKEKSFKPYNFDALGVPAECGHLHPLLKVRAQFRQIFLEMGFTEMPTNNFVENSFWNFDALFQPQQHPARDAHDTFFISEPAWSSNLPLDYVDRVKKVHSEGGYGSQGYRYHWKLEEARKNLLRTHTTAVSARMLYKLVHNKNFVPVKYFSIDRVFRNETLDATHLAEFHQVEGVVADYNLGLGDLIGILHEFFGKLGITQLHFKPAYNPYTEPSMEIFSYHTGLRKWIEVGNSGVFRPEMLSPMGIPGNVNVIAWGLSLERPTMIKYKVNNIRDLVGPKVDLKMVYDSPICRLDKDTTSIVDVMKVMDSQWDTIYLDLGALQTQVASLQADFGVVQQTVKLGNKYVVIVADPRHPPYSICVLLKLLSDSCRITSSIHVHSSIKHVAPQLMHFFNHADGDECDLSVMLIWKDVGVNMVLVESPFNHHEIMGEVNIARYFNRLLESKGNFTLAYECKGEVLSGMVDTWMDKIYSSIIHGQNKEYTNILNNLKILFKKQGWLAGSCISVADICLWSVFKQSELVDFFPSEVKKWYENCCQGLCYLP